MRWSCILVQAALLALVVTAQQPDNSACQACHDVGQKLAVSAHSNVACSSCHEKHDDYPHPANIPKPQCGTCHTQMAADYKSGVHGQAVAKGNQGAPDCGTCHGAAHEVKIPDAPAFRGSVPETCGMCHGDIADQYKGSIHGKAIASATSAAQRRGTTESVGSWICVTACRSPIETPAAIPARTGGEETSTISTSASWPRDRSAWALIPGTPAAGCVRGVSSHPPRRRAGP